MKYDCVWYWVGGLESGEWRQADAGTRDAIQRSGRVAHNGLLSVGPPDGPPSAVELAKVLSPINARELGKALKPMFTLPGQKVRGK